MRTEEEGLLKKQDYHAISNEEDAILQLRTIINKNNRGKSDDNFQNNFFTNLVKSLELGNDSEVYIDLDQINDIRYINKHFNNVYSNLTYGSSYFGVVETLSDWRKKQWMFKLPIIGWIYRNLIHRKQNYPKKCINGLKRDVLLEQLLMQRE